MSSSDSYSISEQEYRQKRYEIAKDLIAATLSVSTVDMTDSETKQTESLVYNCALVADMLLLELGYVKSMRPGNAGDNPDSSVRTLKDILGKSKE